ncbi:MAG: hypothetical protein EA397_20325, partial [Deltaproteobacteria bacterium]
LLSELDGRPELMPADRDQVERGEWTLTQDGARTIHHSPAAPPDRLLRAALSVVDSVRRAWSTPPSLLRREPPSRRRYGVSRRRLINRPDRGEGSLDRLVAIARATPMDQLHFGVSEKAQLFRRLKAAAGDRKAQREAVRIYAARDPNARTELKRMVRNGPERFLALEGSGVWIGPGGWRSAEARLQELSEMAARQPEAVAQDLRELRDEHLDRLNALEDWSRFPEVPRGLRADEIHRTLAFVERVESLGASAGIPDVSGPESEALHALLVEVAAERRAMQSVYDAVVDEELAQGVGRLSNGQSQWERLEGQRSLFGVVDGPAAESYRRAERIKREGEALRRQATEAERRGRDLLREGVTGEARGDLRDVSEQYVQAGLLFAEALDVLQWIGKPASPGASQP